MDIADSLAADASFHCHKTVDYSSEDRTGEITPDSKHCAGALIVPLTGRFPDGHQPAHRQPTSPGGRRPA